MKLGTKYLRENIEENEDKKEREDKGREREVTTPGHTIPKYGEVKRESRR